MKQKILVISAFFMIPVMVLGCYQADVVDTVKNELVTGESNPANHQDLVNVENEPGSLASDISIPGKQHQKHNEALSHLVNQNEHDC